MRNARKTINMALKHRIYKEAYASRNNTGYSVIYRVKSAQFIIVLLILHTIPVQPLQTRHSSYVNRVQKKVGHFPRLNQTLYAPDIQQRILHRNIFKHGKLPRKRLPLPVPTRFPSRFVPSPAPNGVVVLKPVPYVPPQYLTTFPPKMMTTNKKCEGRKHLINDVGVVSLVMAVLSSIFGFHTIVINSMTSNNVGLISGVLSLLIWAPSTFITLFNKDGPLIYNISNFLNGASFLNSIFGFIGVIFGTLDVLGSAVGESIGVVSLILSIIATFPDFFDAIIDVGYNMGNKRRLEHYIENYGCSVPGLFQVAGRPLYDAINDLLVTSAYKPKIEF